MNDLGEALKERFCSDSTPYINTTKAYHLFNHVIDEAMKEGGFDTTGLDLKRNSDGTPKGVRTKYHKVLHAMCTEDKRHEQHSVTVWYPKDQNLGPKVKGDFSVTEEEEIIIAKRVVAKRKKEGVDTLDAAQNKGGTMEVNENPKTG